MTKTDDIKEVLATIAVAERTYQLENVNTVEELRKHVENNKGSMNVAMCTFWFFVRSEAIRLLRLMGKHPTNTQSEYIRSMQSRLSEGYLAFNLAGEGYLISAPDVIVPQIIDLLKRSLINHWYQTKTVRSTKVDEKGMERLNRIQEAYWQELKDNRNSPLGSGKITQKSTYLIFYNANHTKAIQITFYARRVVKLIELDEKTGSGREIASLDGSVTSTTLKQMKDFLSTLII